MKDLIKIASKKPELYEQGPQNMWDEPYISKNMLKAHLDEDLESATRKLATVKESVEWIASTLPPHDYPLLLDLGCGPGIYAERFYGKGYRVTGLDLSRRSIAYARNSANDLGLKIQYKQGDYTKMAFDSQYNLVTLIYCDFGVLPYDDRKELLLKIHDSLLPQGVFLFDVFTLLRYEGAREFRHWDVCENGFWKEEPHLLLHSFYRYDEDSTFLNRYVIASEDTISFYNVWEHVFTFPEIKRDLEDAGFSEIAVYGNVMGKPYDKGEQTLCILAKK